MRGLLLDCKYKSVSSVMDFALKLLEKVNYPWVNLANADYEFYQEHPQLEFTNPEFRRTRMFNHVLLGYMVGKPFGL